MMMMVRGRHVSAVPQMMGKNFSNLNSKQAEQTRLVKIAFRWMWQRTDVWWRNWALLRGWITDNIVSNKLASNLSNLCGGRRKQTFWPNPNMTNDKDKIPCFFWNCKKELLSLIVLLSSSSFENKATFPKNHNHVALH